MTQTESRFLQALNAFLRSAPVEWESPIPEGDWVSLFALAQQQHALPMVYEAVSRCPAFRSGAGALAPGLRSQTMQQLCLQTARTAEFLSLYRSLGQEGIEPLVVKGLICRSLYPQGDLRLSGDEDLLIPPAGFLKCHDLLLRNGMVQTDPEVRLLETHEVSYRSSQGTLYIELHKQLFPAGSQAYGDLNRFFEGAFERSVTVDMEGTPVRTLCPTDHLFYLICHAFKHFLHSGFGLRQVCDIALFANAWGGEIDWNLVLEQCRSIRAGRFAGALLKIAQTYLTLSPEQAELTPAWTELIAGVDEGSLLEDLLKAGVYGSASESRLHSSTITLQAVANQNKGKAPSPSLLRTVFPDRKSMEGKYPVLKKHPVLLPYTWADRIVKYRARQRADNSAADSLRIGRQRLELLRKYQIID